MQTKNLTPLAVALAAATLLAGCQTAESQIQASGKMGQGDDDFIGTAYAIAQLDQRAGSLAATRATDPRVKDLAAKMSDEAGVLYPELKAALAVEKKPVPSQLPSTVQAEVAQLSTLSGPAFDKQFVADELATHQQAVEVLQHEDATTSDGALKAQVETELPAVQGNLAALQTLSDSLKNRNT